MCIAFPGWLSFPPAGQYRYESTCFWNAVRDQSESLSVFAPLRVALEFDVAILQENEPFPLSPPATKPQLSVLQPAIEGLDFVQEAMKQ
jgi:hypothetical protein